MFGLAGKREEMLLFHMQNYVILLQFINHTVIHFLGILHSPIKVVINFSNLTFVTL